MNLTHETVSSKIVPLNKMQIVAEVTTSSTKFDSAHRKPVPMEMNKVGQSVFYDCLDLSPMAEKQDDMKPERSDTEEESKHTIVHSVHPTYKLIALFFFVHFFSVGNRSRWNHIQWSHIVGQLQH